MRKNMHRKIKGRTVLALGLGFVMVREGSATTLRLVNYNIDDSDQGNNDNITGPDNGVGAIMQAIGLQTIRGDAQPIDVLTLEEMLDTNNNNITSTTLPALTNVLNSIYGAGTYAYSTTPDPTSGGTQFNGPSGLIYNTHTVQLLGATSLLYSGNSSDTNPRAPMRYELAPVGYGSGADFYMYVTHMKSGETSGDKSERGSEAANMRSDEATLPANSSVIYTGDFNSNPPEAEFTDLTAAGQGEAYDPENFSSSVQWFSDSTDDLEYRDDYALMTSNVLNDTGGMGYVSGSFQVFGNNGTTADFGKTNAAGNTSLNDLNTPSNPSYSTTILNDLMQPYGSDHMPVISDYSVFGVLPLPANWNLSTGGTWNASGDWASELVPNVAGETVNFAGGIAAPSTVTLDGAWTAGTVTFNNTNSYTLGAGTSGTLTLDNGGAGSAAITDFGGTHSILAPINLNATVVVTVNNAADAIQISGNVSGAGGVTTGGSGAVTLSGVNSYGGPTLVNSGLLVIGGAGSLPTNNNLTIGTGSSTGTVQLAAGTGPITASSLTINPGSTLDITNNSLVINFGSSADPVNTIVSELAAGYSGTSAWTGTSGTSGVITSSTAAAGAKSVSVGYLDGNIDTTDSAQVGPNQILVKYTLTGDTNLDGIVNFTDFATVLKNFAQPGTDWAQGNFTYNPNSPSVQGTNFTDFADVLANFLAPFPGGVAGGTLGGTIQPLSAGVEIQNTFAPIPEPASLSILGVGAAGLLARRRRAKGR